MCPLNAWLRSYLQANKDMLCNDTLMLNDTLKKPVYVTYLKKITVPRMTLDFIDQRNV